MDAKLIGKKIRNLRKKTLRMNQTEFSKRCGFLQSSLSQWENGLYPIPLEALLRIAATFNISLDELVGLSPPPEIESLDDIVDVLTQILNLMKTDRRRGVVRKLQGMLGLYQQRLEHLIPDLKKHLEGTNNE